MIEAIQDEELVKADIRNQERMEAERMPWEGLWREIDERFPDGAGGFNRDGPGQVRGQRNYDTTHITANERFAAAGVAITTPETQDYIKPRFADPELMKIRGVQLWCEAAGRRMYDIRHAQHTGFIIAANEDWGQLGRYGTSLIWTDVRQGRGLFYRTLHLANCWIDTDYAGLVDTVHRKFEWTARELEQFFGIEALTQKMRDALDQPGKEHTKFEVLQRVSPNTVWDQDRFDHRRFPISSRFLALDEKVYLRRSGFHTMPISASRHITGPEEKYGRSPAINLKPAIDGLNAMKHTILRSAHKLSDPALLFSDDDGITRLSTKPGGMNPGLVDEQGRAKVQRMPGGENGIPFALEMMEQERGAIRNAFLEEFFKILNAPNSRMTTTEVLEVMAKQGVLVRPYASRYAAEKQFPMSNRDLDIALRNEQIDPLPPEVQEAGAWPLIDYENPLAAMARAESTSKSLRYLEAIVPLANAQQDVLDRIDADAMARGMAEEIGVRASYIRSDVDVARIRAARAEAEQSAIDADLLAKSAGATLDFAKAGAVSEAA